MKKEILLILTLTFSLAIGAQSVQDYKMSGPYEVVARDGAFRSSKNGSERDMKTAYDCSQTEEGKEVALKIIQAYASTLKAIDGHDAPLCTIQGYDLVRAMTVLRRYKTSDWDTMVRNVWLPVVERFEADSPYANGNWGAIVNRMRMACAIYLEDKELYRHSVDYFLQANDNGALPKYISATGQCQETGRDQAHVQLGLEALAQTCEMAWQQGDDLWGALDNRLLKGFEYTAKYNLGYDVPFEVWTDCTGLYNDWTEPGAMSRGKLWDIYQLPYNHYHRRKGMDMPYTEKAIGILKDEKKKEGLEKKLGGYKKLHEVYTYTAPEGAPLKSDYDVFIQPRGGKEWTKIDTYKALVNAPTEGGQHKRSEISYAFFDFTGDVFVRVVCKNKKYKSVRIRPDYKGVLAHVQNDSTVQFLLFQPENVSVEFDGNITDNLLLFTSKCVEGWKNAKKEAEKQKRTFLHFGPGYYTNAEELVQGSALKAIKDTVFVPSNTTLYLDGGFYFNGTFAINDAENVCILGRGIARPDRGYEGAHVYRSRNVRIDGLMVCTCPVGESSDVTLYNVKSISHPGWGDGLNVFGGCRNITYDRVFCRNSDDCTTVYATRKGFSGGVYNVQMNNSTLWADVAHPIFIGIHGRGAQSDKSDSIVGLRYENIDILCQAEPQIDYQGCMAINCGDNNVVKDVVFDNIRVEEIRSGALVAVKVGYNQKYCSAPGRSIEDITFRNIRYGTSTSPAKLPNMSIIAGYDNEHTVRNITFEGLKLNGKLFYDNMPGKPSWYKTADLSNFYVNDLVQGLIFNK